MNTDPLNWHDQPDFDQLKAESIGWIPLDEGACLHLGDVLALVKGEVVVIEVVGVPDASMAGMNVLLLV